MKRVLSIDGGGIRGIIPALVLHEIEECTGKRIAELFDLIVGTSTGGILALGATVPDRDGKPAHSARKAVKIYQEQGQKIFTRTPGLKVPLIPTLGLFEELYAANGLEEILQDYFGNTRLSEAITPVVITSYDIEIHEAKFLKSADPDDAHVLMREAARATSAAPTYFEPIQIEFGINNPATLIDGGVFANNPAMCAYVEARKIFKDDPDVFLVSLGTGQISGGRIEYDDAKQWGKLGWILGGLLDIMFNASDRIIDEQLKRLLGEDKYFRLQIRLESDLMPMDETHESHINTLHDKALRLIRDEEDALEQICNVLQNA